MTKETICMIIAIISYLGVMIGVGVYYSKNNKENSANEFYLGGRKLGPIVTAMSAEASDMSSWLLMGLPGLAYITGIADAGWTAMGLAFGTYINWLVTAKRLRRYTLITGDCVTIPEFFSRRYRDNKRVLNFIASIVIIIFFVPYTASGFKAVGTLFSSLFGVDYHISMVVGALIIIGYTVLGGFLAVSTTDLIQSIVMSIALIVILGFGVSIAGGFDQVIANAQELPGYLSLMNKHDPVSGTATPYGWLSIASTFAWGLGYFGMPHILLRFMAIKDEKQLKTSRRIASIWVVISMCVAIFIGIVGYSATLKGKIPAFANTVESETLIIELSRLLSENGILLALVAGVVLAGILACTMSTADSQLLTAASSVSENLIQECFKVKLSAKKSLLAARATVVGVAAIGIFLAWDPNSSVFNIVSFAWAGFGASFGAVMLLALTWKRSNKYGAIAGMISGSIMVFVWKYLIAPIGGVFGIYELLPAFLVSLFFIVVVSLLTPAPEQAILDEFDEMTKKA